MHSKSDNIEVMTYDYPDEIMEERFETQIKGSDFAFVWINLLFYKCHKIIFKRGGSYIDSPDWIKKKKATMNLKNDDDKCFQFETKLH